MTDRKKLVAGNWKMNGLRSDGLALAGELARRMRAPGSDETPVCDLLICPPATLLTIVCDALSGSGVALGGQDCHPAPKGAFTGDISAEMLADAGCSHVILGHSERRHGHGESDALIRDKIAAGAPGRADPNSLCRRNLGAAPERPSGRNRDRPAGRGGSRPQPNRRAGGCL